MNELTDPDEQFYYICLALLSNFNGDEYMFDLWWDTPFTMLNRCTPKQVVECGDTRFVYNTIRELDKCDDIMRVMLIGWE